MCPYCGSKSWTDSCGKTQGEGDVRCIQCGRDFYVAIGPIDSFANQTTKNWREGWSNATTHPIS